MNLSNLDWEYECEGKSGLLKNTAWGSIEGFTSSKKVGFVKTTYTHPSLAANTDGNYQVRLKGTTTEVTLTKAQKLASAISTKDNTNVNLVYNEDGSIDYDTVRQNIFDTVVESTTPELTVSDVTIRYNAGTDLIKNWQPLNTTDWTSTFTKFGPGEWTIQFSWAGNKEYKGATAEVKVNVTDNRLASAIVCKEGVSFTYNMDAAVMKQAIFDNVIDWENSTLPAKDTLTVDNFTMEYYGSNTLAGDIDGGVKQWAPIEGGTVTLLTYAQMGAGEQQIRITYKGNAQYRPSAQTESTVTVNKAKVKVKSTSIYAGEALPEDFVTMNPADKFDVYTVYGGLTSNANLSLYLELPDKYTNSAVLKLLDPVVEKLYGKTFTQMMNDGMTVGELRQLLSTQELLDLLEKLHIDTGTFGQILKVLNNMPSIADSVRVSFGTPNRAGLYTVTAITDNKNYETGVGVGTLLVKMRKTLISKQRFHQTEM